MRIVRLSRAARHFGPTWRYVFNFGPTVSYKFSREALNGEAKRVLIDLNQKGIAITSAARLPGTISAYAELEKSVDQLEERLSVDIKAARVRSAVDGTVGEKTFLVELLGVTPVLDRTGIYARFALQPQILKIANAYFGMYARLRYYNIWHTLAADSRPRESQLWHRDREDRRILKVFVCLSNVTDDAGPFTYAPGTHRWLREAPAFAMEGDVKRTTDEQMAQVVAPEKWIKGVGPRGTIIFADTSGFHKGGFARRRDRIMYTCMFTSPASDSKELLTRTRSDNRPVHENAFALAATKPGPWLNWR